MKKSRNEVIKHSAAIQMAAIGHGVTLLQRKIWNVLLALAYDELPTKEEHFASVKNLMHVLEFESKNEAYLKEALEALVGCKVLWNVLDKDEEYEWAATTLLAQAKIKQGTCTYAYSPELRRRLHNPRMYARLSLSMQNKFESKHAQALWELCLDYLGGGNDYGETAYISVDTFRKLMGIADSMYPAFMRLNEKVIKPAIEEVNRVSDFHVTVDFKRQGRRVVALKFKMRRVAVLPAAKNDQGKLFPEEEDTPPVVRELQNAGLSTQDALTIWQQGFRYVNEDARPEGLDEDAGADFVRYIREKIHLMTCRQASGKVTNSTGFLLEAIKKNYANPTFVQEHKRKIAAEAQQMRREREKQVKVLEQQKAEIEKARDTELEHIYGQIALEAPAILDQAASELWVEDDGFKFLYNQGKSALENYQSRPMLKGYFHPYLQRHDPARFEPVRQRYEVRIAALDAQIAALQPA